MANVTDLQSMPPKQGLSWAKIAIGFAILVALVVVYRILPVSDLVEAFRLWVGELGVVGWVVFVFVYALTTFILVPGSVLTLAAGVAFGLWGFPLVIVGATLGSAMSFLAARYVFHGRVQEKVAAYPKFNAVNQAIGDEGWKVVGLLRLSPALPFSLQNWFLGLTPVGFVPAQLATFFGIMPGTLLYVWIGSLGGQAAAGGNDMSVLKYAVFAAGICATLLVTVLVTKKAKAKLSQIENRHD